MNERIRRLKEKYMSSIESVVQINNDKRDVVLKLFTYDILIILPSLKNIFDDSALKKELESEISKKYPGYTISHNVKNFCINMPLKSDELKRYIYQTKERDFNDVYEFAVKLLGSNIVI